MHRLELERADRQARPALEPTRTLDIERQRIACSHREQKRHPLVAQATQRELERERRRTIEPLRVVHRDEYQRPALQGPERRHHALTDGGSVGRTTLGVGTQERGVERMALGIRQRTGHHVIDAVEQIAQCRESKLRLAPARTAAQNLEVALGRR
jgi:hypothetical protein